jgi:beta-1,3-N-acetylglucosaminyltransferase 5
MTCFFVILYTGLKMSSGLNNPIIQQDFDDSFYNVTLKLFLQFKWANSSDPHTKFLMIVNDEIFMHMPDLMEYHQELEQMGIQDFWIGHVHHGTTAIMNKSSKYSLSYEMYQPPTYPGYGASTAYVISSDIVAKV